MIEALAGFMIACFVVGLLAVVLPAAAGIVSAVLWLLLLPLRFAFYILILPLKVIGFLLHCALAVILLPFLIIGGLALVMGLVGGVGVLGFLALLAIGLPILLLCLLLRGGSNAAAS